MSSITGQMIECQPRSKTGWESMAKALKPLSGIMIRLTKILSMLFPSSAPVVESRSRSEKSVCIRLWRCRSVAWCVSSKAQIALKQFHNKQSSEIAIVQALLPTLELQAVVFTFDSRS